MPLLKFLSYFIWLFLLFVSSCQISISQHERDKYRMPMPSLEKSVEESLATSYFTTGHWPRLDWWQRFQSESLNRYMELAFSYNPTIEEAKKRVVEAHQEAIVTRSILFPLVTFDTEDTKIYSSHHGLYRALNPTFPISANLVDILFNASFDFDIWGKNRNLFFSSIGKEMTKRAEQREVELQISTLLALTFFAIKSLNQQLALYEQLLDVRMSVVSLQKKMQFSSLYSALDPYLGEEYVYEVKKVIEGLKDEIEVAKHLLNTLMGRSPDCFIEVGSEFLELQEAVAIPSDLRIGLLARRPDLMAQIWVVEALGYEVGASIANYYPDFSISAFLGLESGFYNNLFQAKSLTWQLAPALSLPIFTAGAIGANVRSKKGAFDAAKFAYNQMLLDSAREVSDLLSNARSIFTQKQDQQQIVEYAKKRYEITNLRKTKGLDSRFQTLALQEEVLLKETENVKLIFDEYMVTIKLIKSLGGGYFGL